MEPRSAWELASADSEDRSQAGEGAGGRALLEQQQNQIKIIGHLNLLILGISLKEGEWRPLQEQKPNRIGILSDTSLFKPNCQYSPSLAHNIHLNGMYSRL